MQTQEYFMLYIHCVRFSESKNAKLYVTICFYFYKSTKHLMFE